MQPVVLAPNRAIGEAGAQGDRGSHRDEFESGETGEPHEGQQADAGPEQGAPDEIAIRHELHGGDEEKRETSEGHDEAARGAEGDEAKSQVGEPCAGRAPQAAGRQGSRNQQTDGADGRGLDVADLLDIRVICQHLPGFASQQVSDRGADPDGPLLEEEDRVQLDPRGHAGRGRQGRDVGEEAEGKEGGQDCHVDR